MKPEAPQKPTNRPIAASAFILATAAVVFLIFWLGLFPRELTANADTERDLLRTLALTRHGVFPVAGPAIDYLPLALPPTWYYLVAPVVFLGSSPVAVHVFHVLLLLAGAIVLCRAIGGAGGVVAGLLLASSTWSAEVLGPVWHNGFVPGAAGLWLAGILRSQDDSARKSAHGLTLAWVSAALLAQVHIVCLAFVPLVGVAHVAHLRRHRGAPGAWPHAVGASVVVGLGLVLSSILGGDLAAMESVLSERVGPAIPVEDTVLRLAELSGAAASWVPGLHFATLVLAVAGVIGSWLQPARRFVGLLLLAQSLVGFLAAGRLAGLDLAPRYWGPAVIPIFGLAGLGAEWLWTFLPSRWNPPGPARFALAVLTPALLVARFGQAPDGEALRETAVPGLREQEAMVDALGVHFQASLSDLGRTHGTAVSGLTAFRYVAIAAGWPESGAVQHLFAAPEGFPEPPGLDRHAFAGGSARPLVVGRFEPRFRLERASTAEGPDGRRTCPLPWPYLWNPLRGDELAPFRLAPGFDAESCRARNGVDESLRLEVSGPAGAEPLVVVLAWFDVVRHRPDRAWLRAPALNIERLEGPFYRDLAVFRVSREGGLPTRFELEFGPLETLAVVDVF